MFKQVLTMIMTVIMVLSVFGGAGAVHAKGDEPSPWAKAQVEEAIRAGIVPERLQGDYQKTITREEFASLFVQMVFTWQRTEYETAYLHVPGPTKEDFLKSVKVLDYNFTDTNSEDVKLAYMMGFVNGTSPTTFSPNQLITREEAAVLLINYFQTDILPFFDLMDELTLDFDKVSPWAKDSVALAFRSHFLSGTQDLLYGDDGYVSQKAILDPKGNFTREQAILIALRLFHPQFEYVKVKIRGLLLFDKEIAKYNFEITKDSIKCLGLREGELPGYGLAYDEFRAYTYKDGKTFIQYFPNISLTNLYATEQGQGVIYNGIFKPIVFEKLNAEENATFDLGWATYEVLNPDFLFEYKIKPNIGVHSFLFYGGAELKEPICELIK